MAVTIVEFDWEHVGNDIIWELEHVVVGDATDHVVVENTTILVTDNDSDISQFIRRRQYEGVIFVAQYRKEWRSMMSTRMLNIIAPRIVR